MVQNFQRRDSFPFPIQEATCAATRQPAREVLGYCSALSL